MKNYVIGIDFGTDSVRSIIADASNGNEIASSTFFYPRWAKGLYCVPENNQFRQHPLDYIEGIEATIKDCVVRAGQEAAACVRAISVDSTGSTPIAVDKRGIPLALNSTFSQNPNAMFVLWKDHTAVEEAAQINKHAEKFDINYLKYVGGIYSSEWYWAKLLHILRTDEDVRDAMAGWVENCDWVPYLLSGGDDLKELKRGVCAAGHKGLWAEEFNGYPPNDFFASLDPLLDGVVEKMDKVVYTADKPVGTLSKEWAAKLGLSTSVVIGGGAFDCHMGCVGGQIEPYYLSKVMGTSTCDMLVVPENEIGDILVKGICVQVSGSIIPGMVGLEAGQSAFGDIYAWFKNLLAWPMKSLYEKLDPENNTAIEIKNQMDQIIPLLSEKAAAIEVTENAEIAIDWHNGRRTPDANQRLKGVIADINLSSNAPELFRALTEATCFGAKAIVERFVSEGVSVKGLIGIGGVAKKNPYIMQQMADIMNMPIKIHKSEQSCALGAAMFAATAAGIYPNVESAMQAMGQGFDKVYTPNKKVTEVYAKRYEKYKSLAKSIEKGF